MGLRPNSIDKTYQVFLELTMPTGQVMNLDMESKGIKQLMGLIEKHEQKGYKAIEEREISRTG